MSAGEAFQVRRRLPPPAGDRSLSLLLISANAASPSTQSILNDMHPILSVLAPERIATEAFTDATAAVTRLKEIYERNTRFLRDRFEAFAKGETPTRRVRATYPFVRVTTSTHARPDSRLSYGFVGRPGVHETTVTRPDLFRAYLTEQIRLLIDNHISRAPLHSTWSRRQLPPTAFASACPTARC